MVYCIGLTGMIASGKSTAAQFFKERGIEVIDADQYARLLVLPGQMAFNEIRDYFGDEFLTERGELNRKKLREQLLIDPIAKKWLENCLHPRIREKIMERIQHVQSSYCIIEIPLLLERKSYPYLQRVLLIEASYDQKKKRLMQRDQCSSEAANAFLNLQDFQETHRALADDFIMNDTTKAKFEEKLSQLHLFYLHLAERKANDRAV